ncbi:MAG: hypothetical protein KKD38_10070 [Candidatus Delongbacteria bacterium]|nr:hypothetical protein [Candidatus Delongbacteria bacterium]MCG2761237.1 hypothetical protein [Candidatus Delongbacteria bacterium]
MRILEKLKKLDRRIIYLLVFLSILIPFLPGMDFLVFPVSTSKETETIFNYIEGLEKGDAIHVDWAFDPSVKAELMPFFKAFFRHCMKKELRVFIYYATINGINLGKEAVAKITSENEFSHLKEGVDYIHMEWVPLQPGIMIFNMMTDYKNTFKKEGVIFEGIETLNDIKYVLGLSGSGWHITWIDMQIRFGYKMGLAVTAVMGPDFIPYTQTGQLYGLSYGLRGAAEYELMVSEKYDRDYYDTATRGMSSLTLSHLVIFGFVIIGNIVYFIEQKNRRI